MDRPTSFVEVARLAREGQRANALSGLLEQFIEEAVPGRDEARMLAELKRTRGITRLSELCRNDVDTYVLNHFGGPLRGRVAVGLWDWIRRCFPPGAPRQSAPSPDRSTRASQTPASPPPASRPLPPIVPGERAQTPTQLRAWAEEHQVVPFLGFPAPPSAGSTRDEGREPDLDPLTIEQVLLRKPAPGPLATRPEPRLKLAWDELLRFADNVAHLEQRAGERWRRRVPPATGAALALAELLRRRREEASRLPARPRGSFVPAPLRFFDHPPRLVYDEGEDPRSAVVLGYRPPQLVTIRLGGFSAGELSVTCACDDQATGCAHVPAALDAALELCDDPELPAHVDLMAVLGVPSWQRLVSRLDENLGKLRVRPPDSRLVWCVGRDDAPGKPPRLEARVVRDLPDGPAFAERLVLRDLEGRVDLLADPIDARAAALLRLGLEEGRAAQKTADTARIFRVLETLAGAPNVYGLDEGGDRGRVEVRRVRPTAVFHSSADGSVGVKLRLGDRLLTGEELSELAPDRRHVFLVDPGAGRCDIALIESRWQALVDALVFCPGPLPPEGAEQLLRRLHLLQPEIEVELPPDLRGETRPAAPTLVFRLTPKSGDGAAGLWVEVSVRPVAGGPVWAPGDGPDMLLHQENGQRVSVMRDFAAERERARAALVAVGLLPEGEPARLFRFDVAEQQRALEIVQALHDGLPDVVAEWAQDSWKVRRLRRADLRVRVDGGQDWLRVQGGFELDGENVPLQSLIEALRQRRRYLPLGPQRFAIIEGDLRARLEAAMDHLHPTRTGVEMLAAAAPALDDLVGDPAFLTFADAARAQMDRLRRAQQHEPVVPDRLQATLRPYQEAGFRWMSKLASAGVGACLADDMGLGKTVQVLAVLLERAPVGPVLVVAPTSVTQVWMQQAARFAPDLTLRRYAGSDRQRALVGLGPRHLVIASYGVVVRDVEPLGQITWAALVLDEAQALKNARSNRARAVRALPAGWRLALTGTPIENHLGELWSIFKIVSPAVLGGWDWFRERFATPIERGTDDSRRVALARVIGPYLLRRTKEAVAPELPPRLEVERFVELSPDERRLYEQIRLASLAAIGRVRDATSRDAVAHDDRFQILAALTRLRQLACHPRLLDDSSPVGSSKLDALVEILTTQKETGHHTLVFSQFTRLLDLAEPAIAAAGLRFLRLDGTTPADERERRVAAFQAGGADVFLISLRAGGFGLTLTAADTVVHLDPWWNPAVEDQATDRTHRIGQARPVTVVRMVARGTVEETVLALHARKRALASGILENAGRGAPLETQDLLALLGETASGSASGDEDADADSDEAGGG
jgi:superfamily II DNA or RNA helicase